MPVYKDNKVTTFLHYLLGVNLAGLVCMATRKVKLKNFLATCSNIPLRTVFKSLHMQLYFTSTVKSYP